MTVTDIGDLDGMGTVTHQWQRSEDKSTWTNINDTTNGSNTTSYVLQAADAGGTAGFYVRYTGSYTDGQGNAYTGNDKFVTHAVKASDGTETKVTQNATPGGTFAMSGGNHVGATLTADGSGITDGDGLTTSSIKYHWEISTNNGTSYTNISGSAGTASTSNKTYTIAAGDVTNKLTLIRAVAEYTDNMGANEAVNSAATAKVAKPIVYLQKVGSSTASKVEIGIFLDDELFTADAQKAVKTWQVTITPQETWATNFDHIVGGTTTGLGAPANSYFTKATGGEWTTTAYKKSYLGSTEIAVFDSGTHVVAAATLDAGNGKIEVKPQGIGSSAYNLKYKHPTGLDTADIKLASLFMDPKDAKQSAGATVKFDIDATNSFYGYYTTGGTLVMDSGSTDAAATAYLTDPYEFHLVL